jgi:hypothetical protein
MAIKLRNVILENTARPSFAATFTAARVPYREYFSPDIPRKRPFARISRFN